MVRDERKLDPDRASTPSETNERCSVCGEIMDIEMDMNDGVMAACPNEHERINLTDDEI